LDSIIELWNWYVNLFFDEDNKVRIAVWGVTITTLTFVLTFIFKPIYSAFTRRFEKIHLEIEFAHRFITWNNGIKPLLPVLKCVVTNRANNTINIKQPYLKTSIRINGIDKFSKLQQSGTFPMKLEPGQQYEVEYDTFDLTEQLFNGNLLENEKVRFEVYTTLGKVYFSKYEKISTIINQLKIALSQESFE